MRSRAVALAGCVCLLCASCGRATDATPPRTAQPQAVASAENGASVPHGDHNPHYGGLVLMDGDLHFEVVLGRDGSERVYFSDATRTELPAATASDVAVTVTQTSHPPQTTALVIDQSGESWIGRGQPVDDPAATVRIAFTARGKPYFIDVPFPR
jgi:hypothetical protein